MPDPETLCVMLAMGVEDGGRKAALAFGVGLSALANGTRVHAFLSLESVRIGTPTGAQGLRPRGFTESLDDLVQHFLDLGGKLEVCSSCYEEYCRDLPKDERGKPRLRAGTVVETLAVIARRVSEMPVLTF
jgi:predicted peroxiredoxin